MSKLQRQTKIIELLGNLNISNQTQLTEMLNQQGFRVTQTTVCRDLEDLGAIKIRTSEGKSVYAISQERAEVTSAKTDRLKRVLTEWVLSVEASGNLAVVKTPPGSAHVIASALDRAELSNVLGTVAGDDTVMIVAKEGVYGAEIKQEIEKIMR